MTTTTRPATTTAPQVPRRTRRQLRRAAKLHTRAYDTLMALDRLNLDAPPEHDAAHSALWHATFGGEPHEDDAATADRLDTYMREYGRRGVLGFLRRR